LARSFLVSPYTFELTATVFMGKLDLARERWKNRSKRTMYVMFLTKITSPTAAEVTGKYKPHPEAKALLQPTHTPTQYAAALHKGKFSQDHIHFLAHGMPERESVGWACKSSAKVSDKLAPADKTALQSAQAWVKNPTPANQSAAAAAAAKTNFQGPGAWAAQGAAWAKPPGAPAAPSAPAAPAAPNLTGHAVAGSVMLAAALSFPKAPVMKAPVPQVPAAPKAPTFQVPKFAAPKFVVPKVPTLAPPPPPTLPQRTAAAKIHQPFIEMGHGIASGKVSFI
jgi:hypothetical protein